MHFFAEQLGFCKKSKSFPLKIGMITKRLKEINTMFFLD